MDLGATVCRPGLPLCGACPVTEVCLAYASGDPGTYPRKGARAERPHRRGAAFVLVRGSEVALVRRPPKGLLGGMLALPTTAWAGHAPTEAEVSAAAPAPLAWRPAGAIDHVFTHFALTLDVWRAEGLAEEGVVWTPLHEAERSLPSVFRKALQAGLQNLL
jgi:A/G-specific adenine glycosylase